MHLMIMILVFWTTPHTPTQKEKRKQEKLISTPNKPDAADDYDMLISSVRFVRSRNQFFFFLLWVVCAGLNQFFFFLFSFFFLGWCVRCCSKHQYHDHISSIRFVRSQNRFCFFYAHQKHQVCELVQMHLNFCRREKKYGFFCKRDLRIQEAYTARKASWNPTGVDPIHWKPADIDPGLLISGTNKKCTLFRS